MTSCPSAERLADLLDEQVPVANKAGLEDHLNDCSHCQQTLLGLAVDTVELQRQQRLLHPDADDSETPAELLSGLKRSCLAVTHQKPTLEPEAAPVVPGYEIIGELGRGGMAVVYHARQLGLNRPVALKMILAGRHAAPELRDRFRREAEAVARLQHPNVVQVYEIGEHDGLPYFSMELVEGGSLKDRLRATPYIPETTAAALVETLARAIHAAHIAGVVHRDLKPANILLGKAEGGRRKAEEITDSDSALRPPPSALVAKIADFGLALHRDASDGWTRTGDVLGTPQYMAPEQAQGRRGDVGPATDIHALAIILYEMLTGRVPFAAQDDMSTLLQVSFEEAVPPRRFRPSVPRDLETICLKCLRKLPNHRYASAHELAEDMRRFQAGEPIHARPISGRERLVKWARRYPAIASLLVGLVVVTVAGFTGVTVAMIDARSARDEETRQRVKAEDAGNLALEALDRTERSVYFGTISQARSQWLLNNVPGSARLLERCRVERRGWEWHYLQSLNHGDLLTITDTGGPWVTGVMYSPDGQSIASVGGDPVVKPELGVVQVHDAATGQLRWRKDGLPHLVRSLAYSPDGQLLAIASGNWWGTRGGGLQLRNATTGVLVCDITEGIEEGLLALAFSRDGRRLATCGSGRPVQVWDTTNGKELYRTTPARRDFIAFTRDGRHLLFDGPNGLEFHEAVGGKLVRAFPEVNESAAISPDGTRLATLSEDQLSVWYISHDRKGNGDNAERIEVTLEKSFDGHDGGSVAVAFRPDGQAVATTGLDGTVRVRELTTAAESVVYRGHEGRVAPVAFHPDGRVLASGGMQPGDIKVWDTTRKPECVVAVSFGAERRDIAALGFTGDDSELLVVSVGGVLRRWRRSTGAITERELPSTNTFLVPATRSAFSDDGKLMAAVADPNIVQILETATGREVAIYRGHTGRVRFVACDRECVRVAMAADGTRDGRPVRVLKVWDAHTGRIIREESAFDEYCEGVALSPDGTQMLEAHRHLQRDADGRIKAAGGTTLTLSSLADTGAPRQLPAPASGVSALCFSPSGRYMAGAGNDGTVRVWDRDGKQLHDNPLPGPGGIGALAFNPDETRLAGVNRERVQVWDVMSGQDVLFLRGAKPRHSDNGFNPRVAWSHDGTRLAASNWDRTATVWDAADFAAPGGKAILAAQAAGRALSWHLNLVERPTNTPLAVAFHRDRLLALKGLSPLQHRHRGDFLARSGLWEQAKADYSAAFASNLLEGLTACEEYAAVLVKCGDGEAYRALRSRVLARCTREEDSRNPLSVLRLGSLLPTTTANETSQLLGVARRYREAYPDSPLSFESLGLALYRAGEWDHAKQALNKSLDMCAGSDDAFVTWVVLALVHLRQGEAAAAEPLLKKVDALLAARTKNIPIQDEWGWVVLAEVRILRDEAESLLPKRAP